MPQVNSSLLESVDYNEDNSLTVSFKKGGTYKYVNVPEQIYMNMMSAESIGSYFLKNVKPNYKAVKIS